MDRRQQKTRKAIFNAFRALLEKKRYDHITVGEIINEANVGRSTFYSHFETKDTLLEAMCRDIFYHIFENDPCPYVGKDGDLKGKLTHTLWHVRDIKSDVSGILVSDSGELFMGYFKKHLRAMFEQYTELFSAAVPEDYLLNHLSCSFAETVKWWVAKGCKESPETVSGYFVATLSIEK